MDIPDELRDLVDRLGQALVQALVNDEQCRELAHQIQETGFDVGLMIEATLALHKRDGEEEGTGEERDPNTATLAGDEEPPRPEPTGGQWSEDDRAFLQKFKISLD